MRGLSAECLQTVHGVIRIDCHFNCTVMLHINAIFMGALAVVLSYIDLIDLSFGFFPRCKIPLRPVDVYPRIRHLSCLSAPANLKSHRKMDQDEGAKSYHVPTKVIFFLALKLLQAFQNSRTCILDIFVRNIKGLL